MTAYREAHVGGEDPLAITVSLDVVRKRRGTPKWFVAVEDHVVYSTESVSMAEETMDAIVRTVEALLMDLHGFGRCDHCDEVKSDVRLYRVEYRSADGKVGELMEHLCSSCLDAVRADGDTLSCKEVPA